MLNREKIPAISVIIPSFDRALLLERAVKSVFAQKGINKEFSIEVIIVDDGSTDETKTMLEEQFIQQGLDVLYYYQANKGVSSARNKGIEVASGEWIALLDSDDEWLPDKLMKQISLLSKTALKICHTEEIWVRNGVRVNQMKKHQKKGGWIFEDCLPMCAMSPSSIVIHQSVFESVGNFDESLPACEDYDLWLRIANQYEVAFETTPCINKYGGHEDQLSRQYWGMDKFRVKALEKVLKHNLNESDEKAAKAMLLTKLKILLKGAIKHQNTDLIQTCQNSLAQLGEA